jgi:hypothetical protein
VIENANAGTVALKWRVLADSSRSALARRIEGMYGGGNDEQVFDSLAVDKQQALLILMRRLQELKLWDSVRRIENLYGEGGVGMNFDAWPLLTSTLARIGGFSSWFAKHKGTAGGFIERRPGRGALHILYRDSGTRHWEAHFDLYSAWASPMNAWRHLLHEKLRKETPDWRMIGQALGYIDKTPGSSIRS